ncbi:MAG: antibiotic biosynthesis monooxygenase [Terriglobales bacterium]
MFARVIDIKTKPGKATELCHTIHNKVLSFLKGAPGFVDELVLVNEKEADHVLALSLWRSAVDAEKFSKEHFPKIKEMIQHHVHATPAVHMYAVDSSTMHRIAAGKSV